MEVFRALGRFGALIVGGLGALVAMIIDFAWGATNAALNISGVDTKHYPAGVGFLLALLGLIGAVAAPFSGIVGAVLLAVAGIGLFFVMGWIAIFPAIFLFLGAFLAYIDRAPHPSQTR
jgi:hypothetical protein